MQGESPKRSVCVLDLSEDELRAIEEWIRRHRGERQMTKLTKDMLGLKMDKNYRTDVSNSTPIFSSLAEWMGFVQSLLDSNDANAQEIEKLTAAVRQKTEEAQKYKTQLTNVLMQFKADKDKNAQVITRLSTELETKCKEVESLTAAKGQADQSKTAKLEETFTKLFEKGREIQELKEHNGSLQAALARSEAKVESLTSRLQQLLSMDRAAPKVTTLSIASDSTPSASETPSPSSTVATPRSDRLPPSTLHSLVTNKSIRRRLLSFLPLDSFLALRHLDLLTHRSLSLDFSLQQALHSLLTEAVQRQHKLSQQTIEAYKQMGYRHGDKYTSYVFYKHAYLRNTAVSETFAKSVTRCAGLVHSAASTVKDKVEKGAIEGGVTSQTAMRDALTEEDNKAKQLKESKTGFFKSFIDKVDFGGTKLSDMLGMPKHTTKTFKELEEHYVAHLDLFKRIGLVYGEQEDFEVQLGQREHQIHTLEVRIGETTKYLLEYLAERKLTLANIGMEEEDLRGFVSILFFSSLQLQECKELRAVIDIMTSMLTEETLNSRRLLDTIEDHKVRSETDARVKRQYLEKAQKLEEKSTSLELKLVDKEEELARKTYEINEFGKRIKDLIQAETKARFANGEYKAKILSQDETIKKLRTQWKSLLDNCKKNFEIVDSLKL